MTDTAFTPDKDWIEIFPYGVAMGLDRTRPLVLFRDSSEKQVVPVWSSQLDAGITLVQSQWVNPAGSPHQLTWQVLEPLGIRLEAAFFTEVRGHHQYMLLKFSGSSKLHEIKKRADQALSFCLSTETHFYCRPEFIEQSRVMEAQLMENFRKVGPRGLTGQTEYLN